MKLSYNILWIDDTPTWVQSIRRILSNYLDDLGFKLYVDLHKDGTRIKEAISNPEIDLIAVDYKLPKINGDQLISQIRELNNFIEIVFYSKAVNPVDVIGVMDGVYHTKREDAEMTIKRVIDVKIRITQDINNMRGLVIAETIDIESQIEEIIIKYFREKGKIVQDHVLDKDGPFDFKKKVDLLNRIVKDIKKEINQKRQDLLKNQKKQQAKQVGEKADIFKSFKEISNKLEDEVIKPRNMLAHVETITGTDGIQFLKSLKSGYENISFNQEWCNKMRKDLLKHSQNLDGIYKHI